MITEWEAVEKRISCRAYAERPIEEPTLQKLRECVAQLRQRSGLPFQLCTALAGQPAVKLSGAMFSGTVSVCAALAGAGDALSGEKVGYYGQELVLYATRLGLGTCWVAGTFDRASVPVTLGDGEKLWDVIPIGYAAQKTPAKQKMIRAGIRARDRALDTFVESDVPFSALPEWVRQGVTAVRMGPSAVNQQPVNIVYKEGRIFARLRKSGNDLVYNDLGIAKRQFEAGAAACGVSGNWDWGDGGEFHFAVQQN